jgi:tetratricopeptide (TPR) repeat protein
MANSKTCVLPFLNNKAIADINRENVNSATTIFHQVYAEAKTANNNYYIQQSLMNLGGLKGMVGDLDSSYYFLNEASEMVRHSQDIDLYLVVLINLASLDKELGRYKAAELKLDSAFALASKWERLKSKADVQHSRAELFAKTSNFKKAYEFLREYINLNEKYLDDERVKAVTEMMEEI